MLGLEAFGPYEVFDRIGSGGMATVHLARVRGGDDWLALKRIHPHLASRSEVQQMFLNEARLLAQLDHPAICGVLDSSVVDGTPYLVMRYLHGVSLGAFITRLLTLSRPMPIDLMAYIAATTCEGLHYAHEARDPSGQPLALVHRDISPQNIFLTFGGGVQLLDFGVAKAAGFETLTRTGRVKGKYAYMSPEQVGGQTVDRRSDIFSLGIVLWESITGRHLFKRRKDVDTLLAIKTGVVPAPSELNPKVPQQLDAIVARSLVADRRRRFATADGLAAALWRYLLSVQPPVGADELSEALAAAFPPPPTPQARADGLEEPFPGWTHPGLDATAAEQPAFGAPAAPNLTAPPPAAAPLTPDSMTPAFVADGPRSSESRPRLGPRGLRAPASGRLYDQLRSLGEAVVQPNLDAEAPATTPTAGRSDERPTTRHPPASPPPVLFVSASVLDHPTEADVLKDAEAQFEELEPTASETDARETAKTAAAPSLTSKTIPYTPLTVRPALRHHPLDDEHDRLDPGHVQSTLTEAGDTALQLHGPTLTPKNDVDRRPIIWGVTVAAVAFLLLVAMTAWAVAVE